MAKLEIRKNAKYDIVSLGEVMLRLDPGEERIHTARSFKVWEGGGEYNVSRGLSKCFGLKSAVLTALVDNPIGRLIEDLIAQGGVDRDLILWRADDGIGRSVRNGLNFTERGFGIRGAVGCSDRGNSAASQLKPGDFDFNYLFGTLGVRWFHTGGIFSALSVSTHQLVLEAIETAKKYGTIVSYDLNYRPSLWEKHGGSDAAIKANRIIAKYIDVLIGNEEDYEACLGYQICDKDNNYSSLDKNSYKTMIQRVQNEFPNIKAVAVTLRTVKSATTNDWDAILYADGNYYTTKPFINLEILDRVGGGDSFASGLIFGFLNGHSYEQALSCGLVHGALAMTTPGDTSMALKKDVERIMNGSGARVIR